MSEHAGSQIDYKDQLNNYAEATSTDWLMTSSR